VPQSRCRAISPKAKRTSVNWSSVIFFGTRGSLAELETQRLITQRVKYLGEEQAGILLKQVDELGRILNGLIRSIEE